MILKRLILIEAGILFFFLAHSQNTLSGIPSYLHPGIDYPKRTNIISDSPDNLSKQQKQEVRIGPLFKVGINNLVAGGTIVSDAPVGNIKYGLCWNKLPDPLISDQNLFCPYDSTVFSCTINILEPSTIYFIRAFLITVDDTIYSDQKAFYSHNIDAVADIDGNYYNPIKIGDQVWLSEDLKTTHLNDGTPIGNVINNNEWVNTTSPSFCWYANDPANYSFPRGLLYNYYTVETGKICPEGWHVASNKEWETLKNFLGGKSVAGGKLKMAGYFFWRSPNKGANNDSNFSSVPGGYRSGKGEFFFSTVVNKWWSSDSNPPGAGFDWYVSFDQQGLYNEFTLKVYGYSIRCIKD